MEKKITRQVITVKRVIEKNPTRITVLIKETGKNRTLIKGNYPGSEWEKLQKIQPGTKIEQIIERTLLLERVLPEALPPEYKKSGKWPEIPVPGYLHYCIIHPQHIGVVQNDEGTDIQVILKKIIEQFRKKCPECKLSHLRIIDHNFTEQLQMEELLSADEKRH